MTDGITRRLAASNIDFEKVPVQHIFKISEGVVGKRVISARTYMSKRSTLYCVIDFENSDDARKMYDYCDGLHIEDTNEVFDLAFVPDSLVLGEPIDECCSSVDFRKMKIAAIDKPKKEEDMVEFSDESEDAPAVEKSLDEDQSIPEKKEDIQLVDKKMERAKAAEEIQQALTKENEKNELEGFKFDVDDPRFSRVFNEDEFGLDASHKKFKGQSETKEIIEKVRKKYKE